MTIGFKVGSITDEIGSPDLLHAFFSTIAVRLEPAWGARFPVLMDQLYAGELSHHHAAQALSELTIIQSELRRLAPSQRVWDAEDPTRSPPPGADVALSAADLSAAFVTSTGRDLIETLREALEELRDRGGVGKIVTY